MSDQRPPHTNARRHGAIESSDNRHHAMTAFSSELLMPDQNEAGATFERTDDLDAPAILRVLESAFDRWPAFEIGVPAIEHLEWKMTPPGHAHDQHAVIRRDEEIVGVQLRWPGRIDVRHQELPFDFGVDMSIHASARGQGLGALLRDSEAERLFGARIVGFDTVAANQQVVDMYESRGPVRRPLAMWVRALTPRAFPSTHRAGGTGHLLSATLGVAAATLRGISPTRSTAPTSETIEPVSAFDQRADALWDQLRGDYELARVRTADWLNWRYLDPRAGLVSTCQATEGDRLLGYAAFRRDGPNGRVLDVVTDPSAEGVGARLLERGAADLRRDGCVRVECLLPPDHREERSFRTAGFALRGLERAVQVTRARNQAVPEIIEVFSDESLPIHLMYGDFDHG